MWKKEQWTWGASDACPFYAPYLFQLWWTEGEGTSIEEYGAAALVNLP